MKKIVLAALAAMMAMGAPSMASASVLEDVKAAAKHYGEKDKVRAEQIVREKQERLVAHKQHVASGEDCDCPDGGCKDCDDGQCACHGKSDCADCAKAAKLKAAKHTASNQPTSFAEKVCTKHHGDSCYGNATKKRAASVS